MAGRMATEGCDVLLGGSFSPDFTDVLSQHITGIYTHTNNTYYLLRFMFLVLPLTPHLPLVFSVAGNIIDEPDIHLILEYSSGAKWGHYTSRRANRCCFLYGL